MRRRIARPALTTSQIFECLIAGDEAEAMADEPDDSMERRRYCAWVGMRCSIMKRASKGKLLSDRISCSA